MKSELDYRSPDPKQRAGGPAWFCFLAPVTLILAFLLVWILDAVIGGIRGTISIKVLSGQVSATPIHLSGGREHDE